jgi:hypothetical protein
MMEERRLYGVRPFVDDAVASGLVVVGAYTLWLTVNNNGHPSRGRTCHGRFATSTELVDGK